MGLPEGLLAVTLGTCVIKWDFIVAEIGKDEGILGNDFAMSQQLTVRPHESAVYVPASSSTDKEDGSAMEPHPKGYEPGCVRAGMGSPRPER